METGTTGHQGLQHRQLGIEADQRRHTGQREHADGHDAGVQGAALVQASQIGHLFGFEPVAREQQDDTKGAQRRQHIGNHIEHRRAVGVGHVGTVLAHTGHQRQQHETHLRNRGEGQHALEVGLCNGRQVTHQQRGHRQHGQHLLPVDGQGGHAFHQQTDHDRKCRQLGRAADHQRDRRGGAVVHVGHPHVERHDTQLERQTGHHEHETQHQYLLGALERGFAAGDGLEHLRQVQGAGGAIDHGQAVQQEAAGQGTQYKVLHGRLGGPQIIAAQGHQGVAGQGQQFQAKVDDQEVLARDHHEHAQEREQAQREQIAAAQHVTLSRIGPAIDKSDDHGHRGKALEPIAHGIADHHATEAGQGLAGGRVVARQDRHHNQRQQRQHVGGAAHRRLDPQVKQRNHAGHHQQQDFRVRHDPAEVVNHVNALLSFWPGPDLSSAWKWPHGAAARPPKHPSRR